MLKRLALGGMAELFLAQREGSERLVVVKKILAHLADEPDFVRMFLDEARIAAQLDHPNIVRVHDLGQLAGSPFIEMEFVAGVDVRKILQEQFKKRGSAALPFHVAAHIVAQVCSGLHYAHTAVGLDGRPLGVIHRDVSPQNVMVGYDGNVKLVDFGIAKATALVERSKPGVIKGKFLYLSPEQLSSERRIDHRADLFALGTMLYELTTGKSPFQRSNNEAVIHAVRTEDPEPPQSLRADYPAQLAGIVLRCLAKDRDRRFSSAAEIQEELEAYLAETPMDAVALKAFVAKLFGTAEERTVLHIPPSPSQEVPRRNTNRPMARSGSGPRVMPDAPPRRRTTGAAPTLREEEDGEPSVTGDAEPSLTGEFGGRTYISTPTRRPERRSSWGMAVALIAIVLLGGFGFLVATGKIDLRRWKRAEPKAAFATSQPAARPTAPQATKSPLPAQPAPAARMQVDPRGAPPAQPDPAARMQPDPRGASPAPTAGSVAHANGNAPGAPSSRVSPVAEGVAHAHETTRQRPTVEDHVATASGLLPAPRPPPSPLTARTPSPDIVTVGGKVSVMFDAPAGTVIFLDGERVEANQLHYTKPGTLPLSFRCPRPNAPMQLEEVSVKTPSDAPTVFRLPCL